MVIRLNKNIVSFSLFIGFSGFISDILKYISCIFGCGAFPKIRYILRGHNIDTRK